MRFAHVAIRGVATIAVLIAGALAGASFASAATHAKKHHRTRHVRRSARHHHRTHNKRAGHRRARCRIRIRVKHKSKCRAVTVTRTGVVHVNRRRHHPKHRRHRHHPEHRHHRHHPKRTAAPTAAPAPVSQQPVPVRPDGVPGSWNLVFDDEFNGSALNANLWNDHEGWTNQNGVTDHASNVREAGGVLTLTLASSSSGAAIATDKGVLAVGDFAEARVDFAGSGTTIYSWPAWWTSGPNWPAAGENDIAEGLAGTLTVNYHSPSGAHNQGTIPGDWASAFHTFGIYRGSNYCDVYWDGRLVKHYGTDDNQQAQDLRFTIGAANRLEFGAAGQMQVDYVRVWAPG